MTIFRIHPAIGIARIGNSSDFYLAPETAAGELGADGTWGGLPLDPATNLPLTAEAFRDTNQALKRQAVRFRIYAYETAGYPTGEGTEIKLGSVVGGKTVIDLVWSVHVANKKLNNYSLLEADGSYLGLAGYADGKHPPLRNPDLGPLDSQTRLKTLVIDPGPRALSARMNQDVTLAFDQSTRCSVISENCLTTHPVVGLPHYRKSFPSDSFTLYTPGAPLHTLGDARVEKGTGRLIVGPGLGATVGITDDPQKMPPLNNSTENDLWFDDISDGPVHAVIVYEDGSADTVVGAWVITGDPGFAPQTRNVVSAWDDVYTTFVEQLGLNPALYSGGAYQANFTPSFVDDIQPILHAVMLQRWAINLPSFAIGAHTMIGTITAGDDPTVKIPSFDLLIRNPNVPAQASAGAPLMPLSLGDSGKPFLTLTTTQYFLMKQWYDHKSKPGPGPAMGAGEALDRIALANCLGGRFSPGIEVSFPVRDPHLYARDWATSGPFRINAAPLDYAKAQPDTPFLTAGYVPLRSDTPLEPGDLSKFMSVPWHTDYNSCAVHPLDPNPNKDNTLYWSWPAERPVAVYPAALSVFDPSAKTWLPGQQLFAVRGPGTLTTDNAEVGRFQTYIDFVLNWDKVGFVVQSSRISSPRTPPSAADPFLEVACQFDNDTRQIVEPWPTASPLK